MIDDPELYQVCPECAGEYRMDVLRCADCDVPLVSPEEIARRDAQELLLVSGLLVLRTAPIAWVRALCVDLAAKGIRYGVDRSQARSDGLLTLLVRRQDREAARAVDAERERIEAPLYAEDQAGIDREPGEPEKPANLVPFPKAAATHKVCPRCGGEYRLDIEVCADCGVELVFPDEAPAEVALASSPEDETDDTFFLSDYPVFELPPSDELVCICCRYPRSLLHLSRQLAAAGISHRVDPTPQEREIEIGCLYVQPADGDAAAAVDAELFGGTPIEEVDPEELTVCPACGTEHSPETLECSGCGLRLGPELVFVDRTCERCGAVVAIESAARCPNCGARLPASASKRAD